MGQVLSGRLLSLSGWAMVIVFNELLIKLRTLVDGNLPFAYWIVGHRTTSSL